MFSKILLEKPVGFIVSFTHHPPLRTHMSQYRPKSKKYFDNFKSLTDSMLKQVYTLQTIRPRANLLQLVGYSIYVQPNPSTLYTPIRRNSIVLTK